MSGSQRPVVAVGVLAIVLAGCAQGGLDPRGPDAQRIHDVTLFTAVLGTAVAILVVGTWAWAVRRPGSDERPGSSPVHLEDDPVERRLVLGGGIAVPAVILAIVLATGVWAMGDAPQPADRDLVVEVVGHQYWWEVTYPSAPGADRAFETANEVRVPVGTPVTVRMTSDDVIHSFSVPQLAGKTDLVPGRRSVVTFTADEPGTYDGYCTEFCGIQHAWMKFEVVAMEPGAFRAWAAGQATDAATPTDPRAQRGRDVFTGSSCVGCHAVRGVAERGDVGPDLTHLATRDEIGAGVAPLDPDELRTWVANAQQVKAGSRMPPQDLDDDDLDALVAWLLGLE